MCYVELCFFCSHLFRNCLVNIVCVRIRQHGDRKGALVLTIHKLEMENDGLWLQNEEGFRLDVINGFSTLFFINEDLIGLQFFFCEIMPE